MTYRPLDSGLPQDGITWEDRIAHAEAFERARARTSARIVGKASRRPSATVSRRLS
jgi:hypothetical protein